MKSNFRRPITIPVLKEFLNALDFSTGDDLLYGAMITVGVFGLFRINELCSVGTKKNAKFIRNQDVTFPPGYAQIIIFQTKTKEQVTKVVSDIKGQSCNPCGLLWSYIMSKTNSKGKTEPLFACSKGIAITRPMLLKFLRSVLSRVFPNINPKEWNGASLRKGGATSAVKAGVHSDIIERLGHWNSDVYKRYVHCSVDDIVRAQAECAKLSTKPDETYL